MNDRDTQAARSAAGTASPIHTYPAMNETIKDLLRRSPEPMQQYILARIEELEAEVERLQEENAELTTPDTFKHNKNARIAAQADAHGGIMHLVALDEAAAAERMVILDTPRKTRFDRIRGAGTPEDMVVELNGNARRFCPKEYDKKPDTCASPCGSCITAWLLEEVKT